MLPFGKRFSLCAVSVLEPEILKVMWKTHVVVFLVSFRRDQRYWICIDQNVYETSQHRGQTQTILHVRNISHTKWFVFLSLRTIRVTFMNVPTYRISQDISLCYFGQCLAEMQVGLGCNGEFIGVIASTHPITEVWLSILRSICKKIIWPSFNSPHDQPKWFQVIQHFPTMWFLICQSNLVNS